MTISTPGVVSTPGVADAIPSRDPVEDARLARLHLRLAMLPLARAELEDLAERGLLDVDGQAALAETRWRMGDLDGAAAAAQAHLEHGGRDPIGLVVAVEAAAAGGRPADARDLMERLEGLDPATIDGIFAGMPRRAHWPSVAGATAGDATAASAGVADVAAITAAGRAPVSPIRSSAVPTPADVLAANAELWDEAALGAAADAGPVRRSTARPTWVEPARARGHADPEAELETARAELSDAPERGLLRLSLVLRLDPTLAADVLDAVRLRRDPGAAIVRGDAERLLGRHLEAESAFADAIESIERDAIATSPSRPAPSQQAPQRAADSQEDS